MLLSWESSSTNRKKAWVSAIRVALPALRSLLHPGSILELAAAELLAPAVQINP